MKLPNNEIGISDILQWRDCPARFVEGMRRHSGAERPEAWSPANAYGSAIHHAIQALDEGATEQEAVQAAFVIWTKWLGPAEVSLMYEDLETYVQRDVLGVRTLVAEEDWRVPLFVYKGEQIYFRFRLDRLYQRLDRPNSLIAVDYKSSKWPKSEDDVHEDLQMWAYNFGIFEKVGDLYPELDNLELLQIYEQLRYGQQTTRKSAAQREEIKRWLIMAATAILEDEELKPEFNEWCPWCSIKMDCPVVQNELSEFAQARIGALMPREPKKKTDGTDSKVLAPWIPDPERFDDYVSLLPKVKRARLTLEGFEKQVGEAMRELPQERVQALGFRFSDRSRKAIGASGLRRVHEAMGDEFYSLAKLSMTAVEKWYDKDDPRGAAIIEEVKRNQEVGSGYLVLEQVKPKA